MFSDHNETKPEIKRKTTGIKKLNTGIKNTLFNNPLLSDSDNNAMKA